MACSSDQDKETMVNMLDAHRVRCCFARCLERLQVSHRRVYDLIAGSVDDKSRKWGVCTLNSKVLDFI